RPVPTLFPYTTLFRSEVERRRGELWASFFQKSRPCFRASPLPKTHGWGIHFDHQGRAALYAVESNEYQEFVSGQRGDVKLLFAVDRKSTRLNSSHVKI